jgi:hypothetical protein
MGLIQAREKADIHLAQLIAVARDPSLRSLILGDVIGTP